MAFITNQAIDGETTLKARLTELISRADTLDMLVGFFCFSGVKVMSDALKCRDNLKLRVLVGMEADLHMGDIVEIAVNTKESSNDAIKARYLGSLRKLVGSSFADKKAFHERLGLFLSMLREGRLEIRKTREPNHAKLYIFNLDDTQVGSRKYWITGSSNFSEPGLVIRDELNVQIGDFGQKEVQEYFDELWDDAVPLTESEEDRYKIIKILQEHSVAADITPFEAYYLVLKNYLEHQQATLKELQVDCILKGAGFRKYRYQIDAVAQACMKLEANGGVIIADVVGLGKSIIGGLIGAIRAKRGMVICPPGLMEGWNGYLMDFKLKERGWEVRSRGKLEEIEEDLQKDPNFDMIIVDEAHNFRNERTESYESLAKICFGREVVLLTATPLNNRPGDLLALLRLFSSAKKSSVVPGGNLEDRFNYFIARFSNIAKLRKTLSERESTTDEEKRRKLTTAVHKLLKDCGIESLSCDNGDDKVKTKKAIERAAKRLAVQMRSVMEKTVIRRNRLDLMSDPDYAKEIGDLPKVCDPKEQFFELTEEQDEFYDDVIGEYFGGKCKFKGAIYHPQEYLRSQLGLDGAQESLFKMLLGTMVQRFESSFGAFRKSLESVRKSLVTSLSFIEKTGVFLYSRKAMNKILELPDEDMESALYKAIREQQEKYEKKRVKDKNAIAYNIADNGFDGAKFKKDIVADINLIDSILKKVDELQLESHDPKATKLIEVIEQVINGEHDDIVGEDRAAKRKVIVFSSYADTVRHIEKLAQKRFKDRLLVVTGANFGKERAAVVKSNFDASFETQNDDYDILIATDKLSEGFNLNRAGLVVNYDIPWNPTRVIQRVGRINRIGKKVFENLYIFNFFPSKKGEEIVSKRATAEAKMFAIHKTLGEDSKMFSEDEEPTAAGLYKKLGHFGEDEGIGFYTIAKRKFATAAQMLEKHSPESFERIKNFPSNIKTAWEGDPKATIMLRRCGPSFFALAHRDGLVDEISLEEAIDAVECKWDTPRVGFSREFWELPNECDKGNEKKGVYDKLKNYRFERPQQKVAANGPSHATQAIATINRYRAELPERICDFAADVAEDIQNFGTIPTYTVKRLAEAGNLKDTKAAKETLQQILESLIAYRGEGYFTKLQKKYTGESVIVTVEKQ